MTQVAENELIREQVENILDSGVLGRSRFYKALLQYLADCADRGHVPKEVEIAAEVFDRGSGFDPAQDSMVRVYAHNLRQKLDQYYSENEVDESRRVRIPKGEYRIALGGADLAPDGSVVPPVGSAKSKWLAMAAVAVVALAVGVVADRVLTQTSGEVSAAYRQVAESDLWAPLIEDETPITVVVGDYFIFGELDDFGNVDRLVREFSINSSRELDDLFMADPEAINRFIDLDLTYLPSSIAFAMRDLMGVLSVAEKDIHVVAMSNLDSSVIRESHIVYLGYLSGLGMLTDFVFEHSELALGETYDELVHLPTGARFVSEAGMPSGPQSYRDYGLVAALPAPGGNRFVFIAGMRDEGLMQTAQAVSDAVTVQISIDAVAGDERVPVAYELVYEVAGLGRTNLDATIVHAAALPTGSVSVGR